MKKYDIPKIEIMPFLTRIVVSSSGEPQYINEINKLESTLTSAEHQKRMESFSDLLAFDN